MFGSSNLIAIDIGEYSVKILDLKWAQSADLTKYASSYQITNPGGEAPKKDGEQIDLESNSLALQQSLKSHKINNTKIITSIALGDAILRDISIEYAASEREIEDAIGVELGESLPFTLDQVYFDFLPKSNGNEQNQYIVAASRRDVVDAKTNVIRSVLNDKQLKDIQVDIDAFAYDRLISKVYEPFLRNNKIILLVDVGHKRSKFYFYGSEGLVYNREQQIGGFQVTETVAEVFDLPFEKAEKKKHDQSSDSDFQELVTAPFAVTFSEQLSLVLDFYDAARKDDKKIERIVFCGGGACLPGFLVKLAEYIEYKVEMLNLKEIAHKNTDHTQNQFFSATYALCCALLVDGVSL